MEMQTGNANNSHNTMPSQGVYAFNQEEPPQKEKRRLTLRTALCTQIFGVFLFTVGLVAGLLIGIYAFHGGPNRPKCEPVAENVAFGKAEGMIGTKQSGSHKPIKPKVHAHGDHGHGHDHAHGHGHDDTRAHTPAEDHTPGFRVWTGPANVETTTKETRTREVGTQTDPVIPIRNVHKPDEDHHDDHHDQFPVQINTRPVTESPAAPSTGSTVNSTNSRPRAATAEETCNVCMYRDPLVHSNEPDIFAPITPDEMRLVRDTLYDNEVITIKAGDTLAFNQSYIQSMSLHPPIKDEVLAYYHRQGPVPGRYGWVSVVEGAAEPPIYMQYKVGPLGDDPQNIKIEPLLKRGECPFERRPYDTVEIRQIIMFIMDELYKINIVLTESFDSRSPYEDLTVLPTGPMTDDEGRRVSRFTLGLRGLGDKDFDFLNILPLHGKVYHGGMNMTDWYIYDIFYINQGPYDTVKDLLKAYVTDQVSKIRYPKGTRKATEELTFPKRNMYVPIRENSHFQGTSTFEPNGPRYDISGNTVSWLGWTFTVATTQHRGPGVYNVMFKNERILYENSLSEIGLVYSADGSGQDNIVFTDATYGIGEARKAIPGVDCPEYAAYLRTTGWDPSAVKPSTKLTICVFEKDAQEPLWRHKGTDVEAGMNNRYLVVRYPTQIGNYDYIIDFEFHLDGKIVTTATATGFIQGSFWNPFSEYFVDDSERTPFGYKVSGTLVGPIHDHTFAFKVDLDVINEKNDFELVHWKYGDVKEALKTRAPGGKIKKHPNYFLYNQTRYITWESVENETAFDIDMINQKLWTVINKEQRNMWNVSRGYRIIPMASGAQNILDDFPRIKEMSFTKHHLHITKYHDDEHFIKPLYNPDTTDDPDFKAKYIQDMVNGESIKNSDIVTWISVGFLHVPTSEDVPMTTRVTTGFTLKPFNFFDSTVTFDIPAHAQGVNDTVLDNAPRSGPCLYMPMTIRG